MLLESLEKMSLRPYLAHVAPEDFLGRDEEKARLLAHARTERGGRPCLLLTTPAVGASELLRQVYDELFAQAGGVVPVYFAWTSRDRAPGPAARHFLQTFLSQWVAYQRRDPALCHALLSAREIVELAPLADQEWLESYLETVERARLAGDEAELVSLCLSVTRRARVQGARLCLLSDHLHTADLLSNSVPLAALILESLARAGVPSVVAGFRRQLLDLTHHALDSLDNVATLHLAPLSEDAARAVLARQARQAGVPLNNETRDLAVSQLDRSPVFMGALVQAARERGVSLNSFRACQELYVKELLGGRISRYFGGVWDEITPHPAASRALLRLLYENTLRGQRKAAADFWRKRLKLDEVPFARLLRQLQAREWVVVSGNHIELENVPCVWFDYLELRYRLEVDAAPRALVLADALSEWLKRAPHTMRQQYRRAVVPPLCETMAGFDGQRVPLSLLNAQYFQELYEDFEPSDIGAALPDETNQVTLPQMVYVASGASYQPTLQFVGEEEGCIVGHGFEAGRYTDADEVIWLAAYVGSKNAAGRGLVKIWHEGLQKFARTLGLDAARSWLVCPSGFAPEACAYLSENHIYGSNELQFNHLRTLLHQSPEILAAAVYEFELVLPMEEDAELLAVQTLEQVARRVSVPPETLNQIKTALVEACINATEHSLSPERKIYQQFRVASDHLTITVASRGVALPHLSGVNLKENAPARDDSADLNERRGWGLQLIRTLMDEVVFERVDDGTRLRMTKYFSSGQ